MSVDFKRGGYSRFRLAIVSLALLVLLATGRSASAQSMAERIARGDAFHIDMTGPQCPADEGWLGNSDPMGTIMCGKTYRIVYRSGAWEVYGYNEARRASGSWTYNGLDPRTGQINLWGRGYNFSEDGRVMDREFGFVGQIRLTSATKQPKPQSVPVTAVPPNTKIVQPPQRGDACSGVRGTPRPPLSAGSDKLRDWLHCNKIGG